MIMFPPTVITRLFPVSCLIVALTLASGCGKQARIEGTVLDGFGAPLQGADVAITGSAFKATTDGSGKYSIEYVPGKVNLQLSKSGYTTTSLTLEIATATTYPAEQTTLFKLPPNQGIFLFGQKDYVPVSRGSISFSTKNFGLSLNDPNFWQNMAEGPRFSRTFTAQGRFTPVNSNSKVKFLDNTGSPANALILVRLKDNDVILTRTSYGAGFERTDDIQALNNVNTNSIQGLTIKDAILSPGKYAFVTLHESVRTGFDSVGTRHLGIAEQPVIEPIYLLEVK